MSLQVRWKPWVLVCALLLASLLHAQRQQTATTMPSGDALIAFLNQTIDWHQRVTTVAQGPVNAQELLYRESARQNARQVLRLGFDFARALAPLIDARQREPGAASTAPADARARSVAQQAAALATRVSELTAELESLDRQLQSAPAEDRAVLQARRDVIAAQLELAAAQRDVIQRFAGTLAAEGAGDGVSVLQRLEDLARSVPQSAVDPNEAAAPETTAATEAAVAQQQAFNPRSAGLFGLISHMFALSGRMAELDDLAEQAEALHEASERFRAPIRQQLIEFFRGSTTAASAAQPSTNPADLAAQRLDLQRRTARFKALAATAAPAREQATLLESSRENLRNWRTALRQQYVSTIRHLLVRLGILAATVIALVVISRVWRRATYRYVHDARRRRQLLLVRRLVITLAVVLIITGSIVSEFGSLATFAGLITAGIAVALQTIILSGVAYFFFIGRYGVRTGDRVTIQGITGDVVEIGLFRLYLMELAGKAMQPTGRIVGFSNAVLFQPQPFYKQTPGANYAWHELSFTLSPDTDYAIAEHRLLGAVEQVYSEYRDRVEQQHRAAARLLRLPLDPPRPQSQLRFTDAGLEFLVRYPVDLKDAGAIDDRITRRLLEAINEEPRLRLAPSGAPRIQSAA
jgi:small-conductance mechanosensitive channel